MIFHFVEGSEYAPEPKPKKQKKEHKEQSKSESTVEKIKTENKSEGELYYFIMTAPFILGLFH